MPSVSLHRAVLANHAAPTRCPHCGALCVSAFRWWALAPAVLLFIPLFAALDTLRDSWLHVPLGVASVIAYLALYSLLAPLQEVQRASVVGTRWLLAALIGIFVAARAVMHFSGGGA